MTIGIIGALPEEIALLKKQLINVHSEIIAQREYLSGTINNISVVLVFSRWGKVAAASTATTLIERYAVDFLIFTGVAGAINSDLRIGDIVIANRLVQYDMDASALPGIERFEIPLLGVSYFPVDSSLVNLVCKAVRSYCEESVHEDIDAHLRAEFDIAKQQCVVGTIASGDRFIADNESVRMLRNTISELQCVEMEGAAVAQVAYEYDIPYMVIRTISDSANQDAISDFPRFVDKVASYITSGSVLYVLNALDSNLHNETSMDV